MSSPANPVRTVAIRNAHPQLRLARPAITAAIAILDQHAARFLGGCPPGELSLAFLTDQSLAKIHADFMNDPTATDVITFAHGEILISTETALRQAGEHGQTPEREVALYLIQGLLHLNGHEDGTETGFAMMKRLQEGILASVWPEDDRKP